jgi:hypothetical protein
MSLIFKVRFPKSSAVCVGIFAGQQKQKTTPDSIRQN